MPKESEEVECRYVRANASSGGLVFFLCSGKNYTNSTGMKWDKSAYPKVATKDYSYEAIDKAWNGYKVRLVYNKFFA